MPALIFLVVAVTHILSPVHTSGDSMWSIHTALSITRHGTTNIDEYQALFPLNPDIIEVFNGHYYTMYPLGSPLLAVPFVFMLDRVALPLAARVPALRRIIERRLSPGSDITDLTIEKHAGREAVIASLLVALTAMFFYLIVRQTFIVQRSAFSVSRALLLTFIFAFCTPVWSSASRSMGQHAPSILMLSIALYLILRAEDRPALIRFASLPLAFSYVCRPTNAISVALLSVYVFVRHRTYFLRYLLWALPIAIPFFVYNFMTYHALLSPYYHSSQPLVRSLAAFVEGLGVYTVSPNRGLFVFAPVLLFSFYGVYLKIRRRSLGLLDALLGAAIVAHWLTLASFDIIWGGDSYGPRLFTDMMPYFVYFLIPVVAELGRRGGRRKLVLTAVFFCAVGVSFLINARGALDGRQWAWNAAPGPMATRLNRVWDWRDLQILRGL
jgi:hypothetical protein